MNAPTEFELVLGWLKWKRARWAFCVPADGGNHIRYRGVFDEVPQLVRGFEVLAEAGVLHPSDEAADDAAKDRFDAVLLEYLAAVRKEMKRG